MRHQRVQRFLLIGIALFMSSCSTFQLTEEPFKPKGKTLAVIAGLTNASSLQAAEDLGHELRKTSQFEVYTQQQVAKKIPNYPQLIKGPYRSAYMEIDEDFSKTDTTRVKEIQKHLGVDYLYVLWAPSTVRYGSKGIIFKNHPMMQVISQVFEAPNSKEIGRGSYRIRVDEDEQRLLRDDMAHVATEFSQKTGMPK